MSILCRHRVGLRGCKMKTVDTSGYCHFHKPTVTTATDLFLENKPDECPVCLQSFAKNVRALSCGHYVHHNCIVKSGVSRCPICRKDLPEFEDLSEDTDNDPSHTHHYRLSNSNGVTIEIPTEMIATAVVAYQLFNESNAEPVSLAAFVDHLVDECMDVDENTPEAERLEVNNALKGALVALMRSTMGNPGVLTI
jgi:hypothetical protein